MDLIEKIDNVCSSSIAQFDFLRHYFCPVHAFPRRRRRIEKIIWISA